MIRFASAQRALAPAQLDLDRDRVVLAGDIVTMNSGRAVIPAGRLCLDGHKIAAVLKPGDALPPAFVGAPVVETEGTIYPGLFDLHNHLPYNMIPLWQVDRRFGNRLEWQNIDEYYPAVTAPFKLLNGHKDAVYARAIVRFAECRGLFGGVTTGHGMPLTSSSLYEGLLRNIEGPLVPELPAVKSKTPDLSPKDIEDLVKWTKDGRPYIYHLSEGVGEYGERVFRDLQKVPGALNGKLVCIHCVGIPSDGFDSLAAVSGVVWSPTSNLLLYGETCKIEELKKRGIRIAVGADWSPSGCKNLLGELKVARAVSRHLGGPLSDADLVAAVTCVPASMIGWDAHLGSIEAGKWADLLVLSGKDGDHYARLVEAKESSIRAAVIGGRVRLGAADGFVIGDPLSSENVSIGGKSYVLDLSEPGDVGLGGMKLSEALATLQSGLSRLPEFEVGQTKLALMGVSLDVEGPRLEDEMHPEGLTSLLLKANKLPAKSMKLEPMAAVDDPEFKKAMRASINMPDYAKAAFAD